MCGVVALYSPAGALPAGAAERARDALAHRGPDGRGLWQSSDDRVALGHTRLSLIDPDAGQPLASEDMRQRLVVNGEFYGYEGIRRDLLARGHVLRTRSDSEVALHLYEEVGAACLADLRGEFAFVLWDEGRQTVFAARDRFGIKPLFYAELDGVLYLASEVKAILAAGVAAAWDDATVYDTLHLAFDPERSLFFGVRQLPPAHYLVATAAGIRIERYWDIPYPARRDARAAQSAAHSEADEIQHVRGLLEDSVRLRLRADVPVGCLVSGGIDSSTVLALATRHSERPVRAFTIGFDGADYDESALAQMTAENLGAEASILRVTAREMADCFREGAVQGEMLQFNAHGSARYLLSRHIHQAGYKTVMAGEGADELFAGYAFVRAALGAGTSRLPPWLAFGARLLRRPSPAERQLSVVSPWLARLARGVGVAGPAVNTLVERFGFARSVLATDFVERNRGRDPYRLVYENLDARARLREWEPAKAMLYVWLRTLFANYHMAADRIDMAHAVEVRLPYLDHVLFEHVATIPTARLARDGANKWLLREVARPLVPEAVYRRVKKPFLAPPAMATPGTPLNDLAHDTLRSTTLPFVDRRATATLLDSLPRRRPDELPAVEALLMALVSLTFLDDAYFKGRVAT